METDKKYARIRSGAMVSHDRDSFHWINGNAVFELGKQVKGKRSDKPRRQLIASGYGEQPGAYGNGPLWVYETDIIRTTKEGKVMDDKKLEQHAGRSREKQIVDTMLKRANRTEVWSDIKDILYSAIYHCVPHPLQYCIKRLEELDLAVKSWRKEAEASIKSLTPHHVKDIMRGCAVHDVFVNREGNVVHMVYCGVLLMYPNDRLYNMRDYVNNKEYYVNVDGILFSTFDTDNQKLCDDTENGYDIMSKYDLDLLEEL